MRCHAELTVIKDRRRPAGADRVQDDGDACRREPVPALAYNFIPRSDAMQDGNAALFYLRSFLQRASIIGWNRLSTIMAAMKSTGTSDDNAWYSIERRLDGASLEKGVFRCFSIRHGRRAVRRAASVRQRLRLGIPC